MTTGWCSMCKVDGKLVDHLFGVSLFLGLKWVVLSTMNKVLECWKGRLDNEKESKFGSHSSMFDVMHLKRKE